MLGAVVVLSVLVYARARPSARSAMVVVLGDVGRSPRMCYHVASLVRHGFVVHVVGDFTSALPTSLDVPAVRRHTLHLPWLQRLQQQAYVLAALLKVPLQALVLVGVMVSCTPRPAVVLVQTPPAIPTLAAVRAGCAWTRARLVVDWHNTTASILALRLGARHVLVRVAAWLEAHSGARAYAHLFVTEAMRTHLVARWRLRGHARVLYDRPPRHFRRLDAREAAAFWAAPGKPSQWPAAATPAHPPARVVSSTSWTPDEDFGMLVDAASLYERRAAAEGLRPLHLIVTGRGPQRAMYERQMAARARAERWHFVSIETAWLAAEDYPRLLGAADAGVSLHASSSGLDLPMKVVDMLGCGLPVCALDFACLPELVKAGVNGAVFASAEELTACLVRLLHGAATVHAGFLGSRPTTWDDMWDDVVLPLLHA